jgi:osmotically-inducible protein OsmY
MRTFLNLKRIGLTAIAVSLMGGALSACVPLLLTGAAGSSVLIATDRRTSGTQLEDQGIELRAGNEMRAAFGSRNHINVNSYNRQVLLTGEVGSAQDKQSAEQLARGVINVMSVINELAVMGNSSITQRSADVLITGRVKAMLIDARDLQANTITVITERGVTYLLGRVSQREAERATSVVRNVPGVLKVVRIFEVISEKELARELPVPLEPVPAKPASTKL